MATSSTLRFGCLDLGKSDALSANYANHNPFDREKPKQPFILVATHNANKLFTSSIVK